MKTEQHHTVEPTVEVNAKDNADAQTRMTRREALTVVGKHAVYTAPAVLAILSATKSTNANAGNSI